MLEGWLSSQKFTLPRQKTQVPSQHPRQKVENHLNFTSWGSENLFNYKQKIKTKPNLFVYKLKVNYRLKGLCCNLHYIFRGSDHVIW